MRTLLATVNIERSRQTRVLCAEMRCHFLRAARQIEVHFLFGDDLCHLRIEQLDVAARFEQTLEQPDAVGHSGGAGEGKTDGLTCWGSTVAGSASRRATIKPLMMPKNSAAAKKSGDSMKTPSCGISHRRASSSCPAIWANAASTESVTGPNQRCGRRCANASMNRLSTPPERLRKNRAKQVAEQQAAGDDTQAGHPGGSTEAVAVEHEQRDDVGEARLHAGSGSGMAASTSDSAIAAAASRATRWSSAVVCSVTVSVTDRVITTAPAGDLQADMVGGTDRDLAGALQPPWRTQYWRGPGRRQRAPGRVRRR